MDLSEALSNLRDRHVPPPRPSTLPTEAEVDDIESSVAVTFPPDFRRYLLEASDVCVGTFESVTINNPESHTHLPTGIESARAYGVPSRLLPFCEDNANFFCFNEKDEIEYWSHNGVVDEKWPDLATWIQDVWLSAV